jgi:exodeoxyribonuclease VII small subunit
MSQPTFEQRLQGLEQIVQELEEGELPLEAALRKFEDGVVLVRALRTELAAARLRVQVLQDDGSLSPAPELAPDA